MSTQTQDDGGAAFPCLRQTDGNGEVLIYESEGMSLRDHFAGLAMQAMVSKSTGQDKTGGAKGVPLIAQYAYEFADAMLKARSAGDGA